MKLPKYAIENYQFILILVLLSVLSGLLSYFTMPRSEDPVVEFPVYVALIVYPGTSPEDLEELVVDPIEDVVKEIEDIDLIESTIEEGLARIRIEASYKLDDFEDKFDEVAAAINNIRDELPDEIALFDIKQVSPLDVAIMQIALSSAELPYHNLIETAEDLEDELSKLSGIRNVEIEAYPEEEIRVALDFQKMAQQNVPLNQVIGILRGNNANIPGGDLNTASKTFSIQTSGGYKSLEAIRNTVISSNGSQLLYLRDIAEVDFAYEDQRFLARYQGQKAVYVSVTQKEGINILQLHEALAGKVQAFSQTLPEGIKLSKVFEQAPAVEKRLGDFFNNLIQGILLVGAVILLFLGFRSSIIVMTVIPTSIIIAIGALDMSGFGLQQISIAGLVIALGLLVDNGIVVVENINRFLGEGYSRFEAAYRGTAEVGWAIISSTVTTLLSFFPLTQLDTAAGRFLKSLPLIVVFALIASLLLALTFTPLLASIFLKNKSETTEKNGKAKGTWVERGLNGLIVKIYRPSLDFALRYAWLIIILSVFTFVASLMLFPLVGVSLFPTADKPLLLIDIDTPEGSSLKYTEKAANFVAENLAQQELVKNYTLNVGHGNPRIYYNRIPVAFKKNHAQLMVNLKEWNYESFYPLLDSLRLKFSTYKGAKISISELKNGPPIASPIEIRIVGENFDSLKNWAQKVENILRNTEGCIDVDNPSARAKTNLKVRINEDKAGLIGLALQDIDLAIRAALTGVEISEVSLENGDKYGLVLRLPLKDREASIADFDQIYIPTQQGAQVPLRQVASLEFERSVAEILHYNLERNFTVTANLAEGYNANNVSQEVIAALEQLKFPAGYGFQIGGEAEAQSDSFGGLGQILLVALVGIFAVLVLQFRSFAQPFIVFSAIPLAFVGSIVALFLTGWTFSFFAFVGFTSLVGIVINNSIILVDYTNQLTERGISVVESIKQACEVRFTPILLTTTTTILGLLPLTLSNSGLWSPLGWTIVGGMVSSTFLTLLVVPVLYKWFTKEKSEIKPHIRA